MPLYAAEHVHVTSARIDGAVATLPILRDLDGHKTLWWLTRALATSAAAGGAPATVTDVTSAFAVLHLAGPRSRDLLSRVCPDPLDNAAFPRFTGRELEVADSVSLTLRVSFTGEIGYELYVPTDQAVAVFDALRSAGGTDLAPRLAGYLSM